MFDAVNDRIIFFTENNITVFTHQFDVELLGTQIPHFVEVF